MGYRFNVLVTGTKGQLGSEIRYLVMNDELGVMNENTIYKKSFEFAKRTVKLYKFLIDNKKEFVISKQLLRCGTSIGANVNESIAAQSKKDFISKMAIASKEARETKYWIDLLVATDYLSKKEYHIVTLQNDIEEIVKILTSIVKTAQNNLKKGR